MDITLISANAATDILGAIVLSALILKERFICRYDLPALLFIITGCFLLAMGANKSEKEYTA